jgi:DNA-binding CsgD family transcriptional regulator
VATVEIRAPASHVRALSSRDTGAALVFLGDLADCEGEAQLSEQVRGLRGLLGADAMILGTVERGPDGTPAISAEEDPPGWFDDGRRAAFTYFSHQQPLVVSHFGGLAPRAEKVTDFLSPRQWRSRDIYNDFYRGAGLDWEIAVQIHTSPESIRCAAIQRSAADFSERDRALLDLVGPHLRAAYARAGERAEAARRIALLERGLERRGEGALLLDRDGGLVAAGPRARRLLGRWFGAAAVTSLPEPALDWLRAGGTAPDLIRGERRLRAHLVTGESEDLVILTEPDQPRPAPAALAACLPLSPREAEVLSLIATGHANARIALELGISPHTVARHLERIYTKLGVQSRTAAATAAFAALGGPANGE